MPLWDDVKTNLAEWYTVTSVKTSELARISSRRLDKFGISREIERQFSELGSFVYAGIKEGREDLLADSVALGLVSRIQELETELREKDQEIDGIKAEYARRQASSRGAAKGTSGEMGGESEVDQETAAANLITDPILQKGRDESAILVEPAREDLDA